MFSSFLITLREGIEAALIVGIILTFLVRTGRSAAIRDVWVGVAAAVALSAAVGLSVALGAASLSDAAQEAFEGIASLLAAGVLTWMIFWMRRQARSIKSDLELRTERAVDSGSALALAVLAFTAVAREGLETVLFLYASFNQSASAAQSGTGAVAGLLLAVAIGYAIYRGGRRINLRLFFQITGGMLIVVSAGLIATAVHELNEAGYLVALTRTAWDTGGIVAGDGALGSILRGLFGYRPAPTVLEVIVYWAYLVPALFAFFGVPLLRERRAVARADAAA